MLVDDGAIGVEPESVGAGAFVEPSVLGGGTGPMMRLVSTGAVLSAGAAFVAAVASGAGVGAEVGVASEAGAGVEAAGGIGAEAMGVVGAGAAGGELVVRTTPST